MSNPHTEPIRVLLIDAHLVVREGLRLVLEGQGQMAVVGEASNGREAMTLVQQLAPDIVLMDVEMPEMDGIEASAVMRASTPQSAVVMLSIKTMFTHEYKLRSSKLLG